MMIELNENDKRKLLNLFFMMKDLLFVSPAEWIYYEFQGVLFFLAAADVIDKESWDEMQSQLEKEFCKEVGMKLKK